MSQAQILVVDDEPDIRQLVREILEDEGYTVQVAPDGEGARHAWNQHRPDLVLLDIWMPDVDGITLLKEWSAGGNPESPVVIMSGHGTLETAVEATRLGAYDFIQKPLSLAKLLATVRKALESRPQALSERAAAHPSPVIDPLGSSAAMQLLRNSAKQAAMHVSPILITGESGSGRETLARYIHELSPVTGDMVVLDHSQADEASARRYLFGNDDNGESTGGLLETTAAGTLFIPELQSLSPSFQALLNNTLESGGYVPLRSTDMRPLTCRIICSADTGLESLVHEGKFLESLYFRLNVLSLHVPALRERPDDIPELVRHFSNWFPNQQDLPYRHFSVSVQNRMRNHSWPGNIRELRNLVERLLVLGEHGEVSLQEVDDILNRSAADAKQTGNRHAGLFDLPLREAREQFEHDYLVYQLKKAGGSVGKLSESVGMERTHLYRKLRSLGIDPKSVARGGTGQ